MLNAEYFFDTDPGTSNATPLSINASDTVRQKRSLATGALSEGIHTLYIRMQSSSGNWSLTENASFYVTNFAKAAPKLNDAEYFIDTDPGPGKAKKLSLPGAADTLSGTINIKVPAGLDTAVAHYFCIRFRNAEGAWSLYELDTFRIKASIAFAGLVLHAAKENNHARLSWTGKEITNGIYEVEKSNDGIDFTVISKINVQPKYAGYSANDNRLSENANYYRVKHTSASGNITYSNIKQLSIYNEQGYELRIFPNPAKDMVTLQFSGKGSMALINIFDAGGHHIKTCSLPVTKNIQINISKLAAGAYTLHISDGETAAAGKLVKQ